MEVKTLSLSFHYGSEGEEENLILFAPPCCGSTHDLRGVKDLTKFKENIK